MTQTSTRRASHQSKLAVVALCLVIGSILSSDNTGPIPRVKAFVQCRSRVRAKHTGQSTSRNFDRLLLVGGRDDSRLHHQQTCTKRTLSPTLFMKNPLGQCHQRDTTRYASLIGGISVGTTSSRTTLSRLHTSATTEAGIPDDEDSQQFQWTRKVRSLAIPALVGMLADPLLSLMDTAYVGRVGPVELAALGACTSLFHLFFNSFRALTTATTSLIGSASTDEERQQITGISLSFGIVLGIVLMFTLQALGPRCLQTMGVSRDSALFEPAFAYLSTRLYAAPAVLTVLVSEGTFRGYGNTKIPLLASVVASLVNLVLDPILMFPLGFGVRGAAAATACSQLGAALVYVYFLRKKGMLPKRNAESAVNKSKVIRTIIAANIAMILKQSSLLFGWAYATARATRIGNSHVAAHQVALSCWLVSALVLDGSAVAGQVLMSQAKNKLRQMRSLASYMGRHAILQGLLTTFGFLVMSPFLPSMFTTDLAIRQNLQALMPHLAWQQLLVSCCLVAEGLAVGGKQFQLLAGGTALSTLFAMQQIRTATSIVDIWSRGIVALFAGRLVTALIGVAVTLRKRKQADAQT